MTRRTPNGTVRRPTPKQLERVQRDQQMALLAAQRVPYEQIAEAFGLRSKSSAWDAVQRVMDKAPAETAKDVRAIISAEYMDLYQYARVQMDSDSRNTAHWHDRAVGILDRMRQLFGTDHQPGSHSTIDHRFILEESQRTGIPVETLIENYNSVAREQGLDPLPALPAPVDGEWREG